jgi:hypothetical protein
VTDLFVSYYFPREDDGDYLLVDAHLRPVQVGTEGGKRMTPAGQWTHMQRDSPCGLVLLMCVVYASTGGVLTGRGGRAGEEFCRDYVSSVLGLKALSPFWAQVGAADLATCLDRLTHLIRIVYAGYEAEELAGPPDEPPAAAAEA